MEVTKNVIITGGRSGIGLASALLFARRGWSVGLISHGPFDGESFAHSTEWSFTKSPLPVKLGSA